MTRPTYDPRILNHPAYAGSYHHYLRQGAPPGEAARLAYTWTQRQVGVSTSARVPTKATHHAALGVVIAVLGVCGLGGIGAALSGTEDTASVRAPSASTLTDATTSPSPEPTRSTEVGTPTPGAPISAPPPTTSAAAPRKPAPVRTTTQPRPPAPKPPATVAPPRACNPSYPDVCLRDGIGDYDCAGGSGNGPNYARGPIRVRAPDPFELDSDHDGWGCERG
jgi:hypothetical protein